MSKTRSIKSLTIIISVLSFIVLTTIGISLYAKGYTLNINNSQKPLLKGTGIVSLTSKPKSASVFIDDHLVTATDDSLNLDPGQYNIKISKDGYLPWYKKISIKKELVYQIDAQLFRSIPDLKPITFTGAINTTISPDKTKVIYAVASASASRDNGLYQIDLSYPIPLISNNLPKLLISNLPNIEWSKYIFEFSPDSKELIAVNPKTKIAYQLNLQSQINAKNIVDITPQYGLIKQEWQKEESQNTTSIISKLPTQFSSIISSSSAKNISYSPAEDKILYLSSVDTMLTQVLPTPTIANQSYENQTRELKKNNYYIYNIKEDTNFLIGSKDKMYNPSWLPDSNSIFYVDQSQIVVIDNEGTNQNTIYSGKISKDIVFTSPDGLKLIILTSSNTGLTADNLFTITIR